MPIIGSFGAGSGRGFGRGGAKDRGIDYLVVAGGGGTYRDSSGGGGAGGLRASFYATPTINSNEGLELTPGSPYPITIGAGGTGETTPGPRPGSATDGNPSSFSTISTTGGGRGNYQGAGTVFPGGSGGGVRAGENLNPAGLGNAGSFSPPEGNPGGLSPNTAIYGDAGGGGAGQAGIPASTSNPISVAGGGGNGVPVTIYCSPTVGTPGPAPGRWFAGGGGGGRYPTQPLGGAGGAGGGGAGCTPGTTNTGGGGGGGANAGIPGFAGRPGGPGIVIARAPAANTLTVTPPSNTTHTTPEGCKVAVFTVSGTITVS